MVLSLNVSEITTEEFGHCAFLQTEEIDMLVTLDYGPRIVSVKRNGGPNLIYSKADPEYNRNHGHKMRITLEKSTNPVYCDDSPVRYIPMADGVSFVQTLTDPAQLELSMDVVFSSDIGSFMVVHSVRNRSRDDIRLSIYTETPFCSDGFVFAPQSNIRESERPSRILSLWEKCSWRDSRLFVGDQYVTVHNDNQDSVPRLKIGINNTAGFCGYKEGKYAIIKRYVHNRTALYPFNSCSVFLTSSNGYLSIQNTSPFYLIAEGESARHIESWIFSEYDKKVSPDNETELDDFINSIE